MQKQPDTKTTLERDTKTTTILCNIQLRSKAAKLHPLTLGTEPHPCIEIETHALRLDGQHGRRHRSWGLATFDENDNQY